MSICLYKPFLYILFCRMHFTLSSEQSSRGQVWGGPGRVYIVFAVFLRLRVHLLLGESALCPAALCSILMPISPPDNSPLHEPYSPITSALRQTLFPGLCEFRSVHLCFCSGWSPLWCLFDAFKGYCSRPVFLQSLTWLWEDRTWRVFLSMCADSLRRSEGLFLSTLFGGSNLTGSFVIHLCYTPF